MKDTFCLFFVSIFFRMLIRYFLIASVFWTTTGKAEQMENLNEIMPIRSMEDIDGIKLISIAVGSYPEYLGANSYTTGLAPSARFDFKNSSRYIQLVGPELVLNTVDDKTWSAGPSFNYRFGRDGDDGSIYVNGMRGIDDTSEIGAFVGWRKVDPNEFRNRISARLQVLRDVGNVHKSYIIHASAQMMQRVALPVDIFISGAISYAGSSYMRTYFGVNPQNLGTSIFPLYKPSSSIRDVRMTFGSLIHLDRTWHFAVGGQYQRLLHSAADSPIVVISGSKNQWLGGIAIVYAWQ